MNNRRTGTFLCLFFILLEFTRCSSITLIDKMEHNPVSYFELPDTVQKIYQFEVLSADTYRLSFMCIDCLQGSSITYNSLDNVYGLIKSGFSYEFIINGEKHKLKANKGNPFVYYNGFFYYPQELNLDKNNYDKIVYNKVALEQED